MSFKQLKPFFNKIETKFLDLKIIKWLLDKIDKWGKHIPIIGTIITILSFCIELLDLPIPASVAYYVKIIATGIIIVLVPFLIYLYFAAYWLLESEISIEEVDRLKEKYGHKPKIIQQLLSLQADLVTNRAGIRTRGLSIKVANAQCKQIIQAINVIIAKHSKYQPPKEEPEEPEEVMA